MDRGIYCFKSWVRMVLSAMVPFEQKSKWSEGMNGMFVLVSRLSHGRAPEAMLMADSCRSRGAYRRPTRRQVVTDKSRDNWWGCWKDKSIELINRRRGKSIGIVVYPLWVLHSTSGSSFANYVLFWLPCNWSYLLCIFNLF